MSSRVRPQLWLEHVRSTIMHNNRMLRHCVTRSWHNLTRTCDRIGSWPSYVLLCLLIWTLSSSPKDLSTGKGISFLQTSNRQMAITFWDGVTFTVSLMMQTLPGRKELTLPEWITKSFVMPWDTTYGGSTGSNIPCICTLRGELGVRVPETLVKPYLDCGFSLITATGVPAPVQTLNVDWQSCYFHW